MLLVLILLCREYNIFFSAECRMQNGGGDGCQSIRHSVMSSILYYNRMRSSLLETISV